MKCKLRSRASMCGLDCGECIVKRFANPLFHQWLAIKRDGVNQVEGKQPQIIEAENVVGVLVRIDDGMNDPDSLAQQLLPQIGRSVDKQVTLWQAHDSGAACSLVARIGAGTDFTRTA